jgi:hypothetical protein
MAPSSLHRCLFLDTRPMRAWLGPQLQQCYRNTVKLLSSRLTDAMDSLNKRWSVEIRQLGTEPGNLDRHH